MHAIAKTEVNLNGTTQKAPAFKQKQIVEIGVHQVYLRGKVIPKPHRVSYIVKY